MANIHDVSNVKFRTEFVQVFSLRAQMLHSLCIVYTYEWASPYQNSTGVTNK